MEVSTEFDPRAEPFWTLAMALAWIIWRMPRKLREFSGLELIHPSALFHCAIEEDEGKNYICAPDIALAELERSLQAGKLIALGKPSKYHKLRDSSDRINIPASEWLDLSLRVAPIYGDDSVGRADKEQFPLYHEVRVERDKVFELWREVRPRAAAFRSLFDDETNEPALGREIELQSKRQAAKRAFEEPYWPRERVIVWIALRKQEDIETSEFAALIYGGSQLLDENPRQTLLRALQTGKIRAIDRKGDERQRECWAFSDTTEKPNVRFRREDVLRLWPEQDGPKESDSAPARWTLSQALTWIIYRSADSVQLKAERFPSRRYPYDVINEAVRYEGSIALALDGIKAREELSDCLKKGELVAYGIPRGEGEHRPIAKTAWDTIDTLFTYDPAIQPEDVGQYGQGVARYRNVYVLPDDVIAIWPHLVVETRELASTGEAHYVAPGSARIVPAKRGPYEPGEKVRTLLSECFPDGVPSAKEMKNSELVRLVQKKHDELYSGKQAPSRDTILRHAKRKNY